ncbi:hypothetical protein OIU76_012361 [Salix suchowensis]|nr:hypothetical protein OIU76_012361 [Salix suchowensis]
MTIKKCFYFHADSCLLVWDIILLFR